MNQALAKLGVAMTGVAYVMWSLDLIPDRARATTVLGALGLAAGIVPITLISLAILRLDVAGAFIVYACHAAWAALLGLQLVRGQAGAAIRSTD